MNTHLFLFWFGPKPVFEATVARSVRWVGTLSISVFGGLSVLFCRVLMIANIQSTIAFFLG